MATTRRFVRGARLPEFVGLRATMSARIAAQHPGSHQARDDKSSEFEDDESGAVAESARSHCHSCRARFSRAHLRNVQSDCAQVLRGELQIWKRGLFRPMAQQVADNLPGHGCPQQADGTSMAEGMRTAFAERLYTRGL